MRVTFGDFVLDRGTRQLQRGDEARHLGPKAFALLELLLDYRPDVVTRDRIRDRLWPGTSVSESTLATVVTELRAALDEDPKQPRFLRTVHRVGYAFCRQATEVATRPRTGAAPQSYRLVLEDREISLRPGENVLGRTEEAVVWIDSSSVSRRHARILVDGGQVLLEDLGSKNGTFVRKERIAAPTPLADGDMFWLGTVRVRLKAVSPDENTRTDAAY